jgi:tetratricopeptide (TPR) repeat protein
MRLVADFLSASKECKRRYCLLTEILQENITFEISAVNPLKAPKQFTTLREIWPMSVAIRHAGVLFLTALMASSCTDPETAKVRHLERGDQYAAEKRDEFAVVEYASVVKLDPKYGEARLKLAETYERPNNLRSAFPEYIRAADALPNDRKAQVKAIDVVAAVAALRGCKSTCCGAVREGSKGRRGSAASRQRRRIRRTFGPASRWREASSLLET